MKKIAHDCGRIVGEVLVDSLLFGIPLAMLWQMTLILCGVRIIGFIAFKR